MTITRIERKIESNDLMKSVVNNVISQVMTIFPDFKRYYKTQEDINTLKSVWVNALIESEINSSEGIKRGISKCYQSKPDFMISPGQFIEWCKIQPDERGFLNAEKAYNLSFCLGAYYGSNTYKSDEQESIVRYTIHLCGGSHTYRSFSTDESKRVFKRYYQQAFERFLEVEEWNKTNDKVNMHFATFVEPERKPLFIQAQQIIQAQQKQKTHSTTEAKAENLTTYEQFKLDAEICRHQSPKDFGKQFRHLTQAQCKAKIIEISSFAKSGAIMSSMPPVDAKYTPAYKPELSAFEKNNPILTQQQQILREKAALQATQKRREGQFTSEQEKPCYDALLSQEPIHNPNIVLSDETTTKNPEQPKDYPLDIGCNNYQEFTALPENPSYLEKIDLVGGDRPLSLPAPEYQQDLTDDVTESMAPYQAPEYELDNYQYERLNAI